MSADRLKPLAELLRRRRAIIADHAWRERDSRAHLEALKSISESIDSACGEFEDEFPPRLNHFLRQCSYDKALAFIESSQPR
jgi:hypothetical protein